jgi:acyl-CoA synthetase (AMP-forming)/AMP-acid ligase II
MNIVEPILFHAKIQPEAPALCSQGNDVISYARLVVQMGTVARRAMSLGIKPGDIVALSIDEPLLHAAIILGLAQAGIITVSVAGHKPPAGLRVDAVISSRPYPFAPEARHLILDFSWMTTSGGPIETSPSGSRASGETCRIVLTSGTTGDPKAVAMTHDMAMARNARYEYVIGNRLSVCSRLYMNMGLAAALGFQFLIYILGRGGTLFFRGDNVENTLRSFEIFRIEAMLATPTMLAQLLAACDQHPSIEVHLDTIISSGGLLPRALLERVRPRLCSHIVTGYGSTEAALSATAPAHRIAHIPGAAGYVTPGIRIEIVDEMGRAVPAGVEGIVRISSDFGIDGYIDDPVESAQVFRDGWFYPGDLGSLTSENLLIISGRQNAVLNAGGGKMSAEKVEAALLSCKGVREAAVFMATSETGVEEVWAGIVTSETVDAESVRAHCRLLMPAVFVPVHVVPLDRLPVNATGKVDRRHLKDKLLGVANS